MATQQAALRAIGSVFITKRDKLTKFVEAYTQLCESEVFCDFLKEVLPRTWQARFLRETTELGREYLRTENLNMNDVAYHIAALLELPGRWFNFEPTNKMMEKDFFRACPKLAEALRDHMGDAWDNRSDQTQPHWRAADEEEFVSRVTDAELQKAMDDYGSQDSALWELILRRLGSGGTTLSRFGGLRRDRHATAQESPVPEHAVHPLSVGLKWLGFLPDDEEEKFKSSYVQDALSHGKAFEPMNVAGVMGLLNSGIKPGQPKYRYIPINMVLVPGAGRLIWISPDGLIVRDGFEEIGEEGNLIVHPPRRIALEAKCQYLKKSVYLSCPDHKYLCQVLGEAEALETNCGLMSFMFYRKKPDTDYGGFEEGDKVEVTLEMIITDDASRDIFRQLLACSAYYLQLLSMETMYMIRDKLQGERYAAAKKARIFAQGLLLGIRSKFHEAVNVGQHPPLSLNSRPVYREEDAFGIVSDSDDAQRTRGIQRRFVLFRRWCQEKEPEYHNKVVELCAAQLDIFMEYFGGDRELQEEWKGKCWTDFKKRRPESDDTNGATEVALRYAAGWKERTEKFSEIVTMTLDPPRPRKRGPKEYDEEGNVIKKPRKAPAKRAAPRKK